MIETENGLHSDSITFLCTPMKKSICYQCRKSVTCSHAISDLNYGAVLYFQGCLKAGFHYITEFLPDTTLCIWLQNFVPYEVETLQFSSIHPLPVGNQNL